MLVPRGKTVSNITIQVPERFLLDFVNRADEQLFVRLSICLSVGIFIVSLMLFYTDLSVWLSFCLHLCLKLSLCTEGRLCVYRFVSFSLPPTFFQSFLSRSHYLSLSISNTSRRLRIIFSPSSSLAHFLSFTFYAKSFLYFAFISSVFFLSTSLLSAITSVNNCN